MRIKRLVPKEYKSATMLVKLVFDEFVAHDYTEEGRNEFYSYLSSLLSPNNTDALWSCEIDGKLVGVMGMRGSSHLSLLFVKKEYHQKGIASSFMAEAKEFARTNGAYCITVNASRYALRAYSRLGFIETGAERCQNGIFFTPMRILINPLALLPWNLEYAAAIAKHANDPLVAENLRDAFPNPYTLENAKGFIESAIASNATQLSLCIMFENEPVGSIGVFPFNDVYRKSAEIGYWLAREQWGRGIMTEAVKQATAEAFARLDIVRIQAEIFSFNTASCRVLEKCGYTHEGTKKNSIYKNGRISDSELYAIINNKI